MGRYKSSDIPACLSPSINSAVFILAESAAFAVDLFRSILLPTLSLLYFWNVNVQSAVVGEDVSTYAIRFVAFRPHIGKQVLVWVFVTSLYAPPRICSFRDRFVWPKQIPDWHGEDF